MGGFLAMDDEDADVGDENLAGKLFDGLELVGLLLVFICILYLFVFASVLRNHGCKVIDWFAAHCSLAALGLNRFRKKRQKRRKLSKKPHDRFAETFIETAD